jgi:hypothetical protein
MQAKSHNITLKAVHNPERNCNGCYFDEPRRCSKADPWAETESIAEAVKAAEFVANTSCNTHPIIWVKDDTQ